MKKALSVLLAFALAMSLAVCAFAVKVPLEEPRNSPPTFEEMQARMSAPVDPSLSPTLHYELPTVTGIEAEWDGDIEALFNRWRGPFFGPDNVTVTVTFEGGETEELTSWNGQYYSSSHWYWRVWYDYDEETGEVLFYYDDSNLWWAYVDSFGDSDWDYVREDYFATLPQTVITVPVNLRANYLSSLPKTALKLGEEQRVPVQEFTVYAFTPAKDGPYYFYSANYRNCDPYAHLYDAAFNRIAGNDNLSFDLNFGIIAELQAGQTYYLFVAGYYSYENEETDRFDVGVRDDVRKLSSGQYAIEFLTGGIFRQHWYADGMSTYYSIPGEGSWLDIFRHNMGILWSAVGNLVWDFGSAIDYVASQLVNAMFNFYYIATQSFWYLLFG